MSMNILVVDDDELLRNELAEGLAREGHKVKSAGSGEEAVEMVKNNDFKLIFTDLKMPGISGLDVLKTVKHLKPHVHMVMITAYGTIETAVEAMKIGADDYITKPFKMEQLESVIENVINMDEFNKRIRNLSVSEEIRSEDPFELLSTLAGKNKGLCITPYKPNELKEKYDLNDISIIWLTSHEACESCINPENIYDLKITIKNFINENPEGVVLLDGLEVLIERHSWDAVRKFMSDILGDAFAKPSQLILPINPDQLEETALDDLKHLISYPHIQQISNSLSSPIRREVVRFLNKYDTLSFTEIQRELELKDPPKLSFHLKKLLNDRYLQKAEKEGYSLTNRGQIAAEYLLSLEDKVLFGMENKVLLVPNPNMK